MDTAQGPVTSMDHRVSLKTNFAKATVVPTPFRGLRVLLVDHDITSLSSIALVLQKHYYKVTTTELATTALAMLHEGSDQFDLVMADVNMTEMDVFAFLKIIHLIRSIPIILMSSREDMDMARKAKAEGVCFFFQKPISTEQLKNVWQHVNRRRRCLRGEAENQDTERRSGMQNDSGIGIVEEGNIKLNSKNISAKINQIESDQVGMVNVKSVALSSEQYRESSSMGKGKGEISEGKGKYETKDNSSIEWNRRENDSESEREREDVDNKNVGSSRKKWRMKWTPELHRKFKDVVSTLGEMACPRRVQEMMNVPGMTSRHVASHLQKYRVQLKLAREALSSFSNYEGNGNDFLHPQQHHEPMDVPGLGIHNQENNNKSHVPNPMFGSLHHNPASSEPLDHLAEVHQRDIENQVYTGLSNICDFDNYLKLLGGPPTGNSSLEF